MSEFDPYGVTQVYTHQSVLAIGAEILTKTLDHEEHERERAIEDAIERTRAEGEENKKKAITKLTKRHARTLQQNLTDLEARCNLVQEEKLATNDKIWQEKLDKAVAFEKDYSDRRLEEELCKTREQCNDELDSAVASTREAEKSIAERMLKELSLQLEGEKVQSLEELKQQHLVEMDNLKKKLRSEADVEIKKAVAEAETRALERISKIKLDHDAEIAGYKAQITAEHCVTEKVRLELEKETHARVAAEERVVEVKNEFRYFINTLPGHENSCYDADYMLTR